MRLSKEVLAWFEGSKLVDSNGKPLICYHQTNETFSEFDKDSGKGNYGPGYYFCIGTNYWDAFGEKMKYTKKAVIKMVNPVSLSSKTTPYKVAKIVRCDDIINEMIDDGSVNMKDMYQPMSVKSAVNEVIFALFKNKMKENKNVNDNVFFDLSYRVWLDLIQALEKQGRDGFIERTPLEKGVMVIVWDKHNIKIVSTEERKGA